MNKPSLDQENFFELLRKANRGRLKIYTGPVAGVGKTYRMLEEAHSLKSQGADVVLHRNAWTQKTITIPQGVRNPSKKKI